MVVVRVLRLVLGLCPVTKILDMSWTFFFFSPACGAIFRFCRHARGIFIPFSLLSFLAWSRSKIGQKLPDFDFGCFRLWLLSLASFRILHNLGALGHTIGHDQWRMVHDWP